MMSSSIDLLRPVLNVLQSFGATAMQPSTYPPGADISGMSEAGVPALAFCRMAAPTSTITTLLPIRSTRSCPANCARMPRRWL